MAQHFKTSRILVGDDRKLRIGIHAKRSIHHLAVHPPRQRGFRQARANGGGNLSHRYRVLKRAYRTIGKFYIDHFHFSLPAPATNKKSADQPHFFNPTLEIRTRLDSGYCSPQVRGLIGFIGPPIHTIRTVELPQVHHDNALNFITISALKY